MERGLLAGLAAFRWAAWVWMATLLLVSRNDLVRPGVAGVLVATALVYTTAATFVLRSEPERLLAPTMVAVELAVGAALLAADGLVYDDGGGAQSLGSAWPVAGVLTAGLVLGTTGGIGAGIALGVARAVGLATHAPDGWALSAMSSAVLFALAGGVAGFVAGRLRDAEVRISAARAREEVARHLHDGVLQTLAVVQRRTEDPDLARLARRQERDLRDFLVVGPPTGIGLVPALRAAAAHHEDAHGGRVEVIVAEDLPRLGQPVVAALTGAVTEALTNAGKHGAADQVTVFVEPDDEGAILCSVTDDGAGFDPAQVVEGVGLPRSIRGRIAEVGGRVDVTSRPGRGTEVLMVVPAP